MIEQLITDHLDLWSSAVRPKSSAGRGSNSKLELTGIKKLRELILELAVRGKLVTQDPNDEPASVLLERIAAEKARLVKEGKIKKSKPLPEITEEEKPFELPEGWGVVRLGEIGLWATGNGFPTIEQGFDDLEILFCKVSDMNLDGNERVIYKTTNTVSQETVNRLKLNLHQKGTVIFPKIGGAIATNKRRVIIRPTAIDNNCLGISPLSCVASNYLFLLLTSIKMEEYQVGTSVPAISQSSLELITLGLPPIDEQHRIVAKVDELMSLCDQLEQQSEASLAAHQTLVETLLTTLTDSADSRELAQNWARLAAHFDSLFTTQSSIDALKQTILQLAVMGKLVPQDPNDEPASVLLERIAAEKARLVKEGKIKKEKPLPPISEEEKPFALPDGWEWCRTGNILSLKHGYAFKSDFFVDVKTPYILTTPGNFYEKGGFRHRGDKTKYYDGPLDSEFILKSGDLIIPMTEQAPGLLGSAAFIPDDGNTYLHNQRLGKLGFYTEDIVPAFIYWFFNSQLLRAELASTCTGTTVRHTSPDRVLNALVPIMSSREQRDIVAKIDELTFLCDQLSARMQASQTTQLQLAEALVEGALN